MEKRESLDLERAATEKVDRSPLALPSKLSLVPSQICFLSSILAVLSTAEKWYKVSSYLPLVLTERIANVSCGSEVVVATAH